MRRNKTKITLLLVKNPDFNWKDFDAKFYYLNKWETFYHEPIQRPKPILTTINELDADMVRFNMDNKFTLSLEMYREERKVIYDNYFGAYEIKTVTDSEGL